MRQSRIEEYLETILFLMENNDGPAKTNEIAEELGVSAPSVTEMLQKLSEEGLLEYRPYHGVTLTANGRQEALLVRRRHQVLETFLVDFLDVEPSLAHEEACELEHWISDDVLERICCLLGHPNTCPDGNVIDSGSCCGEEIEFVFLSDLKTEEQGYITAMALDEESRVNLGKLGIRVGAQVRTSEIQDKVIRIALEESELDLDAGLATRILVRRS